jgi:hypothetical protein
MKQFYPMLLVAWLLASCTGSANLSIDKEEQGFFGLDLGGTITISSVMMEYLEDVDLVMGYPEREDGLPSTFNDVFDFLQPYVDHFTIERLPQNQLGYQLAIANLALFHQQFSKAGFKVMQFYQDERGVYHLKMEMSDQEHTVFYNSISLLPRIPRSWQPADRQGYIQQLANILGSTRQERARVADDLDKATITLQLSLPSDALQVIVLHNGKPLVSPTNSINLKINVIDFFAGHEQIHISWQ